ncbi:MAG TPA: 50S ribosomal protein L6 [Spirochaetes bacterium]|nr:50S ribosomal protein L6 [Spirochaetota bacterium]
MSRIGKQLIEIPDGVSIDVRGGEVVVKGPLGSDSLMLMSGIELKVDGKEMTVVRKEDIADLNMAAFHGLSRALVANLVTGVSKGFERDLEIVGVGYRATQQDKSVVFQLGYSHNITFTPPDGVEVQVLEPTKVKVKGINKQIVGQVAANIRKLRPPEPYKGKGIRYKNERIRKKAGKAGKK